MAAAIVGSLIGAAAVVGGVWLSQRLAARHQARLRLAALVREISSDFQILQRQLGDDYVSHKVTETVLELMRNVGTIEAEAGCLRRRYASKTREVAREVGWMLIASLGRIEQHGGKLPQNENLYLFGWLSMIGSLVQGDKVPTMTPDEFQAAMRHYAVDGLATRRPGAPQLIMPSSWLRRLRGRLRRRAPETNSPPGN